MEYLQLNKNSTCCPIVGFALPKYKTLPATKQRNLLKTQNLY